MSAKKLLVLDDDPGVVSYLSEVLEERGYHVTGLSSAKEALARALAEPFDLVITDVEMPEMRGTDLLAAILARKPRQLVMLITGFGSIDLAVAAVKSGACDFITKPFNDEVLLLAVERALRDREMRREITRLRAAQPVIEPGRLVARSAAMQRVLELARRAARSDATVLLLGETGTGKNAVARLIHDLSRRSAGPFVELNCAALPASLVESELFGSKKGAFTDATDRPGLFASAAGGTILLDEIGELPMEVQAKLLHVLESGKVRMLGGSTEQPVDARLVAATNRTLEDLLGEGRFRPDLYYRLNVIRVEIPPLRERRDDLQPLIDLFLQRAADAEGREIVGIAASALRRLYAHDWPGNVRELANAVERAVALCEHDTIVEDDILLSQSRAAPISSETLLLEEIERDAVRRALEASGGNKTAAARALGINRRTLYRKLS